MTPRPGPVGAPPGYGLAGPADGSTLPWAQIERWLVGAHSYWVCATRADGRPHAMPVWGLWHDGELWFSTDPTSHKARNLAARPEVVVHLERGDEVVVLEGSAERVTDAGALARFDDVYDAKYSVRPSSMGEVAGVYRVRPRVALTWTEADFPATATRWVMDP